MADFAWPPSLPQAHKISSTFSRKSATIYTGTGAGTTKTRRQFSSAAYNYSDRLVFTTAQLATFDSFFVSTIDEGAVTFEWVDPRNGNTVDQIILGYPEFREIVIGTWEGIARFEVLAA